MAYKKTQEDVLLYINLRFSNYIFLFCHCSNRIIRQLKDHDSVNDLH